MTKKRLFFVAITSSVLFLALGACKKKMSYPNCKSDSDCRVEAQGAGGVCYLGKCEECVEDIDCMDLKQCIDNRCVSSCTADADCGPGRHCENSSCFANCMDDAGCMGDHICSEGRCVSEAKGIDDDALAWAEDDCSGIELIHFDFDRFEVKSEYSHRVDKMATCLSTNPSFTLIIEGHTDDRGTPSYNIALGQKRADAVKKYLMQMGVASNRIKTISYGEGRPIENAGNEYAWQQNRRAEFVLGKN